MDTPGAPAAIDSLQARFEQFHEDNPNVYATLERLAREWLAEHSKVGLKMLWEVARWQLGVNTTTTAPRLNNNWTSRYARLLIDAHPEWADRIETRELRAA
jgi:hypothetical protein